MNTLLRVLIVCGWLAILGYHLKTIAFPAWGWVRSTDLTATINTHLNKTYQYTIESQSGVHLGAATLGIETNEALIECHQQLHFTSVDPLWELAPPVASLALKQFIRGEVQASIIMQYDDRARVIGCIVNGKAGNHRGRAEIDVSPRGLHLQASSGTHRYSQSWTTPTQHLIDSPLPFPLMPANPQAGDRFVVNCLGLGTNEHGQFSPEISPYVVYVEPIDNDDQNVRVLIKTGNRTVSTQTVSPEGVPLIIELTASPIRFVLQETLIIDQGSDQTSDS